MAYRIHFCWSIAISTLVIAVVVLQLWTLPDMKRIFKKKSKKKAKSKQFPKHGKERTKSSRSLKSSA
ncbi:hypothetical protein Tco_0831872 [Tanacetum coccineum]